MGLYKITGNLKHNSKYYTVGDEVNMTAKQAQACSAVGDEIKNPDSVDPIHYLVKKMGLLDKDNKEHWTNDNKPDTRALSKLMGSAVSAADRDRAWDLYQETEG